MTERILYCVNDLAHADFQWSSQSEFLHLRKYDCNGNPVNDWTFPVQETYSGALRCSLCGGEVFLAQNKPRGLGEKVISCDFLGRCQDFFQDENLNNLEKLLANLAGAKPDVLSRKLAATIGGEPLWRELLEKYGLLDLLS